MTIKFKLIEKGSKDHKSQRGQEDWMGAGQNVALKQKYSLTN